MKGFLTRAVKIFFLCGNAHLLELVKVYKIVVSIIREARVIARTQLKVISTYKQLCCHFRKSAESLNEKAIKRLVIVSGRNGNVQPDAVRDAAVSLSLSSPV